MTNYRIKKFFGSLGSYTVLTIIALISVFPLVWMLISSTNTSADVIRGKLWFGTNIIENYKTLTSNYAIWKAMANSFFFAIAQTLLSLLICSLAGYGFEIYNDKHKDRLMALLLTAMMVPFASIMIPLFRIMSSLKALNSAIGFILPALSTPFLIMMFRQGARSFPHDIIEAARIDGLGELSIFFHMFIPTMKSTYAAAMTITFMNAWNNYIWAKIVLIDGKTVTMPMVIANMIAGYTTDYGALMLAVLLATIPTILIFFILQKSFTEGIAGAVK